MAGREQKTGEDKTNGSDPRIAHFREASEAAPLRKGRFDSMSGMDRDLCYFPQQAEEAYYEQLGMPGQFPYTRGVHPTMYRTRLWTMRQFAGFGSPEDTNARFKYLLEQGQTGLSTAFDMPTLMGYDPDHELSAGEVGREGVNVATIHDMRRLFADIPLEQVTTSMTINAPAIILLAFYVAVADERGVPRATLGGTLQNDILKEFIAQKEWISPPRPSMRIIRDMLVFNTRDMPRWNSISISGYHIREAGATAVQELAFTLADGIGYVQAGIDAGLDVDDFAPRLSFFFDVHNDFFEEIAKLRAARRMWARIMRDRFGAKSERSWKLRTHCQTAGVSLTAQQPYNNVARVAIQALAGVLGGTQSLHTNSMDETYALPTQQAVTIALRTQQLIAEESGVADVVDPLGGSWYVEAMTDRIEAEATRYIDKIDDMGGIVRAIEEGYPQHEISDSAFRFQREVEKGDRGIVGVNKYADGTKTDIPTLHIAEAVETGQKALIAAVRANRDASAWSASMDGVRTACQGQDNLVDAIIVAVKAEATLGEICDVFREEFGVYRDPAFI